MHDSQGRRHELTDRAYKLTDHGYKLTDRAYKLTDHGYKLTDHGYKLTDGGGRLARWRNPRGWAVRHVRIGDVEALFTTFLAIFAVLILWFSFSAVYRLFRGQR